MPLGKPSQRFVVKDPQTNQAIQDLYDRVQAALGRRILLENGSVLRDGAADEVADYYNARVAQRENERQQVLQQRRVVGQRGQRG